MTRWNSCGDLRGGRWFFNADAFLQIAFQLGNVNPAVGDLAGVRGEWDSYERAVHADTWAAAEPSPKLVDLRRELLSPSLAS